MISLALALWSASGGTGNLITAVNVAYDEKETRNFVKKRGLFVEKVFNGRACHVLYQ